MLDTKQIMEILPHRSPFLLVDRIDELEPGVRVVGHKSVTYNEPFFAGHFPQEPVMPGVLICEALAQAGAVAILSLDKYKGKLVLFGGINKARFRQKVVPGDVLRLEMEVVKVKGPVGVGKATAYVERSVKQDPETNGGVEYRVESKVCTEAELTFVIQ
ncbi:MAG: 3-hydroxyacyl-ACP dehydratase FabZ [Lachnospiraceae bacterium]|nr:3-hydroxyacyl-ACP dehydratase FabZ [Lachnospiraceae bacterium]